MRYNKTAQTVGELVTLMKKRGLLIDDDGAAIAFLERVSYFRLKGFLLHFEKKVPENTPNNSHKVPDGTKFSDIMAVYELDRQLRLLLFEAIEKIEICFRSSICNTYCIGAADPHWLLQDPHFKTPGFHARMIARIQRDIGLTPHANGEPREKEVFVSHYMTKYGDPPMPPVWVLLECVSLGLWSQVYEELSNRKGVEGIAKIFQVPGRVLASWMHALTICRNICAHHGRLWNRSFVMHPETLPSYENHFTYTGLFYSQAFIAAYLLKAIHPETTWPIRMRDTMLLCPASETMAMGLMKNWQKHDIWTQAPLPKHEIKTLAPKS